MRELTAPLMKLVDQYQQKGSWGPKAEVRPADLVEKFAIGSVGMEVEIFRQADNSRYDQDRSLGSFRIAAKDMESLMTDGPREWDGKPQPEPPGVPGEVFGTVTRQAESTTVVFEQTGPEPMACQATSGSDGQLAFYSLEDKGDTFVASVVHHNNLTQDDSEMRVTTLSGPWNMI